MRFPGHSQEEREIKCSSVLNIPQDSIDLIIAEVKNNSLNFNDTITKTKKRAKDNWTQMLNWIGLFKKQDFDVLISDLIDLANKNGTKQNDSFGKIEYKSNYGLITIRPILFAIEKSKSNHDSKIWINGTEILKFIWECFCPEILREGCSTRYPFKLWSSEYSDIVEYIKDRDKKGQDIGSLDDMYSELIK